MGTGRLMIALAWRNLRHRPWQALLLLVSLGLSTTAVTMVLALTDTASRAWDRAAQATNGFHVEVGADAPPNASPSHREQVQADLARLGSAPGVVAAAGPWRSAHIDGEVDGIPIRLRVQVRDTDQAVVNQPLVTAGRWLDERVGAVLEDGFATSAGLEPGDVITIAGQQVPVNGSALTTMGGPYPTDQPARVWVSPATAERLETALDRGGYAIELRLADPDQAQSFAATVPEIYRGSVEADLGAGVWQNEKADAVRGVQEVAAVLATLAIFVVGLTIATAAILVAGRMAAQIRQVGTLKAVGVTPGQVTCVLLVEYLAVAVVATAIGLGAGTLLAPRLARLDSALSVYGAQPPPITWPRAAIAVAIAITVVVFATVRPALRGVRQSTLRSLGSNSRPPRQPGRLIRAAARLPLPLPVRLGLRAATRRRGRFVATTFGLTFGITMVIATLAMRDGVDRFRLRDLGPSANDPDPDPITRAAEVAGQDRLSTLGFTIAGFIVALAVVNAAAAAVFSANDSARNHAIQRSVGATPGQTVTSFLVAHLAACLVACALGIPLGIAFYSSSIRGPLDPIGLSGQIYAATVLTALLVYAAIAYIPARLLARAPVAPQLTYE